MFRELTMAKSMVESSQPQALTIHARVANLRPAMVADTVVGTIVSIRMPWVKFVLPEVGGADGSFILVVGLDVFTKQSEFGSRGFVPDGFRLGYTGRQMSVR